MEVKPVELPFNYFMGTTNMLEGLIDQINEVRSCVTAGCNGKYVALRNVICFQCFVKGM